jgi:signal transduction histidine kinase
MLAPAPTRPAAPPPAPPVPTPPSLPGPRARLAAARRLRLPRRTVRLRLTVLYGSLFLVCGAALLGVTYILVEHALPGPVLVSARSGPGGAAGGSVSIGTGQPTTGQPTTGQSITGLPAGGQPVTGQSVATPPVPGQPIRRTFSQACAGRPPTGVGLPATPRETCAYLTRALRAQRSAELGQLLTDCGIALAIMALASIGLGWLVAGRVLRPLRTITAAAQRVSASSLNHRLALAGPDDELRELGETFNGLLARLESSFGAQRQFVANASHELRTPLARQRTLVEVALADPQRSARSLQAACERVLAAGAQQEHLIESMLTLARSQRGLDRREPVDLRAVAGTAVETYDQEARQRGVRVGAALGPAAAFGDARLIERLAVNLVDNALRHNAADGSSPGWVEVTTGTRAGGSYLTVANSGRPVPPAEIGRLFEPFQRLGAERTSTAHTTSADGTRDGHGLGLSIVAAIAAAHDARLTARPLPAGGLTVEVWFPPQQN